MILPTTDTPYSETYWCDRDQCEKQRLTHEGHQVASEIMAKYPHPMAMLKKIYPKLLENCRMLRLSDDEIDSVCMEGVVKSIARFRASANCKVTTVIAWGIRGAITDLIRKESKHFTREMLVSHHWTNCEDAISTEPEAVAEDNDTVPDLNSLLDRSCLDERSRAILLSRFSGDNLRELGMRYRISKERVRQIQASSLRAIRQANQILTGTEKSRYRRTAKLARVLLNIIRQNPRGCSLSELKTQVNERVDRWIYEALKSLTRSKAVVKVRHGTGLVLYRRAQ